jgi:hypothetical protein
LQQIAKGRKMAVYGLLDDSGSINKRDVLRALARYVRDWFDIDLVALQDGVVPDVVLVEEVDVQLLVDSTPFSGTGSRPALLIICANATRHSEAQAENSMAQGKGIVEFISKPCGPYKLAKALQDCVVRLMASSSEHAVTNQRDTVSACQPLQPNGLPERLKEPTLNPSDKAHSGTAVQTNGIHSDSQFIEGAQTAIKKLTACDADAVGEHRSFPFPDAEGNGDTRASPDAAAFEASTYAEALLPSPSPMVSPGSISVTPPNSPRVLLVDDNKINLSLLKAFMKKRKYDHVDSAADGSIAVNAIKAATEPYDLIFMGKHINHFIPLVRPWTDTP